jgi:NTP pyrophosphatase (non-canonical NTP hydrolase)
MRAETNASPSTNQQGIGMLERLIAVTIGYSRKFPDGNEPFQMMTRLLEECGELAQQVNHFENSGVKRAKHGEPSKMKMAEEVQDVLCCAFQVAQHYHIEAELEAALERAYQSLKTQGFVD